MKKVILSITFAFIALVSFTSFGQSNHPSKFELILSETIGPGAIGRMSSLNTQYVVVDLPGTSEENYKKIIHFINTTYKNPKEVIVAQSENEYVKINGFAQNLNSSLVMGVLSSLDVRYTLTYFVKDGKLKVELGSIETFVPSSQYSVGGWYPFVGMYTHKKNGELKNNMDIYMNQFSTYFNNLVTGVVDFKSTNTSLANTNQDW
jgi:hypothetical protein